MEKIGHGLILGKFMPPHAGHRYLVEFAQHFLYLLLDVDVPWVNDRQRYLPHARREFFDRCRQVLESHGHPYVVIRGDWTQRLEQACRHAQRLLD